MMRLILHKSVTVKDLLTNKVIKGREFPYIEDTEVEFFLKNGIYKINSRKREYFIVVKEEKSRKLDEETAAWLYYYECNNPPTNLFIGGSINQKERALKIVERALIDLVQWCIKNDSAWRQVVIKYQYIDGVEFHLGHATDWLEAENPAEKLREFLLKERSH